MLSSVDRKPVDDLASLRTALEEAAGADALLLRVRDGNGVRYVVLERE